MKYLVIFAIVVSSYLSEGYKILVVFPFPARSHNNLGNGVIKHLLRAGHEVTYLTPYPLKDPHTNLRQIDVSSNEAVFPSKAIDIRALMTKEVDLSEEKYQFFLIQDVMNHTYNINEVKKLINDPNEHFDVVVAEYMFNDLHTGLGAVFDCPFVWVLPYEPYANPLSVIDEPTNPSYVPHLGSTNVPPLTFTQRVWELLHQIYSMSLKKIYFPLYESENYEKIFGPILAKRGRSHLTYGVMKYNISMMLQCSHISYGQFVQLPQNMKYIGGHYIDEEVKPLPDDLKKIMDNAKHGVIYFSMGSNLKSKELPNEIKQGLLNILGQFKQTVVWKFEEKLSGLPTNVHIVHWAPQQSILAHPNCLLFVTHGGLLSLTETVHFGVPIIGIPVFADQFNNVNRAVSRGFGKHVDISFTLAEDLKVAIEEIINNPIYGEKAKEVSMIYHDRPVSPGAELVHWVEHVVRTRGALHLRSPALHMPFYQKMYLDLLAIIILVFYILTVIINKGICCTGSNKVDSKKKNN